MRQHHPARGADSAWHYLMRRVFPFVCAVILVFLSGLAGCSAESSVAAPSVGATTIPALATPSPEPSATPVMVDVTLYLPNDGLTGLATISGKAEDSPRGLLSALVDAGALPDVNFGTNITFGVAFETISTESGDFSGVILRLDLSDAFAQAVRQAGVQKETLILQSLANTFLVRYNADAMILTIEGTVLETAYGNYETPISFNEFTSAPNG